MAPFAVFQVEAPPSTTGVVKVCKFVELLTTLPPAVSVRVKALFREIVKALAPELNMMLPTVAEAVRLGATRFETGAPKNTAVEAALTGVVPPQFAARLQT
jgi:hypothetical protein